MKEIKLKGLNETIYFDQCKNGLPVYLWVREKGMGYYATLSVKYGSIDTEFKVGNKNYQVPNGVAHFLEHLKFNESDGSNASDFYQKNGSDVNAFTTFNYTSYEVYGTEQLKENVNHLLDFVMTPYFTKKMVQNEKNIIVEENKMDLDNPGNQLYYGTFQNVFKFDKHRNFITGMEEDILATTLEDIELVFDTFYHPKNMFLVITGNFNPYEVITFIKENQDAKEIKPFKKPKTKEIKEPFKVVEVYEEKKANVEIPKLRIAVKMLRKSFKERDDYKLRFLLALILNTNFGATSDLYEDLLNKDLIVSLGAERAIIGEYVFLFLNVVSKYPDEVLPILKKALKNLSITEKELTRKLHSSIANMVLSYDDMTEINTTIQEQIMNYGKIIDNKKDICESITLDDAKQVLKDISLKEMAVVVLKNNVKSSD